MKLLKFSAEWCEPCKNLSNVMENIDLGVPLENIDIDTHQILARTYEVRSVPTVLLVDTKGDTIKRFSGVQSKAWIEHWIGDIYD